MSDALLASVPNDASNSMYTPFYSSTITLSSGNNYISQILYVPEMSYPFFFWCVTTASTITSSNSEYTYLDVNVLSGGGSTQLDSYGGFRTGISAETMLCNGVITQKNVNDSSSITRREWVIGFNDKSVSYPSGFQIYLNDRTLPFQPFVIRIDLYSII